MDVAILPSRGKVSDEYRALKEDLWKKTIEVLVDGIGPSIKVLGVSAFKSPC